jgi:hypothetical protein
MIAIWNYAECIRRHAQRRGLIAENRDYWNMAEALAQIGLTPP